MNPSAEHPTPPPEFSRPIPVDTMPRDDITREIEASPAECQALAARFGLQAIGRLAATVRISRVGDGRMARVRGELAAEVVQTCVVTLDPVPASVAEHFTALFVPEALMPAEDEIVLDPARLDEDLPEPMTNGVIDIGELTAQHLSLALDPYPRRPGAEFPGLDDDLGEDGEPAPTSPFRALAELKRRQ